MEKLLLNVSVSSLLSGCPRYIVWHSVNPTEDKSFDLSFGTLVHLSISQHAKTGLKTADKELVEKAIAEVLPNWDKSGAYIQLYTITHKMTQAALDYLDKMDYIQNAEYELPITLELSNVVIKGIADVVAKNHIIDWKTGYYVNQKHKVQVAIYSYLLNRLGMVDIPSEGSVIYIMDTIKQGFPTVIDFRIDEEITDQVESFISNIVQTIEEQGAVPKQGDACKFCPYKKLCF